MKIKHKRHERNEQDKDGDGDEGLTINFVCVSKLYIYKETKDIFLPGISRLWIYIASAI